MSASTDFDEFIEAALRIIDDDDEAIAVIEVLVGRATSTADDHSIAARRLRLAQYAGTWNRRPTTIADVQLDLE